MISTIRLYLLGTGGSWPTPQRNTLSIALRVDDEAILFDCGESTQTSLMKSSLSMMKINRIFITHYHGDHFLGLPGLIQTMSFYGRTEPLEIYGPVGSSTILGNLLSIGYYSLNFDIKINDLEGGNTLDFGDYSIHTAKANHTIPALSYAFLEKDVPKFDERKIQDAGIPRTLLEKIRRQGRADFKGRTIEMKEISAGIRKGRKISYSGDTRRDPGLINLFRDSTILIHEATGDSSNKEKVVAYGHSTGADAAIQARESGSKKLILLHFSPRYNDIRPIVDEARAIFSNVLAGEELAEIEVGINDR
ncbi:MAG: ribonuclease Z [Thermoplasmatales archaeon]